MNAFDTMDSVLEQSGLTSEMSVALIDWKLFTESFGKDYKTASSMPSYIVEAVKRICGDNIKNGTALLIGPDDGIRITNSIHAIADFEYYATVASQSVKDMMSSARPGMSEKELALKIRAYGQPIICHPSVKSGENARKSLISPTDRPLRLGDELSLTLGMEGGLASRKAYLAFGAEDLAVDGTKYMEEVVKPYMAAVFNWYEMISIGAEFGQIYDMVTNVLPKEKYGWTLNPGHYIASEEWMSSPFFGGSTTAIRSGMMLQMDIIPSNTVYCAPKCEDGICVLGEPQRKHLESLYPRTYERCMKRRAFMMNELGLELAPEVMPMSNLAGEYRPYYLRFDKAIVRQ